MFKIPLIAFAVLAASTTYLLAQDRIDTNLLATGDWSVNKVAYPEDPAGDTCLAETNNAFQTLTLYGYIRTDCRSLWRTIDGISVRTLSRLQSR